MRKRKNEPFYLKDSFFYLKDSFFYLMLGDNSKISS